ncbi:MAG: hypothetical protein OER80_06135 [Gammaproteobacteria bacterium]|nr:hypothetical protein [Gammaproteobacteria bacterium]
MKMGTLLAIVLFGLVTLAHLLRLLLSTEIVIENWQVPMWVSLLGVIVPATVALLLFRESRHV